MNGTFGHLACSRKFIRYITYIFCTIGRHSASVGDSCKFFWVWLCRDQRRRWKTVFESNLETFAFETEKCLWSLRGVIFKIQPMKEPVKKIVVGGINKDFDDFFFQNSKIFTSSHVECEIKKKIKTLFARSFLKIKVVPQFTPFLNL